MDFEQFYLFAKMLPLLLLDYGRKHEGLDLSALNLTHYRTRQLGQQQPNLGGSQATAPLTPMTDTRSAQVPDKHKLRLLEIIAAINDLFEAKVTEGDAVTYVDNDGISLPAQPGCGEHKRAVQQLIQPQRRTDERHHGCDVGA